MKNIAELCALAHANSKAHGFWNHSPDCVDGQSAGSPLPCKCENRDVAVKIALIHSEFSEALEEYRIGDGNRGGPLGTIVYKDICGPDDKPIRRGIPHEAFCSIECNHKPEGFVIELADAVIRLFDLIGFYGKGELVAREYVSLENAIRHSPAAELAVLHTLTSTLLTDLEAGVFWIPYYRGLLQSIERLAQHVGGDIDEAIRIKMAYNSGREFMHGGKAI